VLPGGFYYGVAEYFLGYRVFLNGDPGYFTRAVRRTSFKISLAHYDFLLENAIKSNHLLPYQLLLQLYQPICFDVIKKNE
jgi:hypothetical protein